MWLSLLWRRQEYPDNHVPDEFLASLRRNADWQPDSYASLVRQASAVTEHLAAISIFLSVFIHLHRGHLDPQLLAIAASVALLVAYLLSEHTAQPTPHHLRRARATKSSILVCLTLVTIAPVLRSLTAPTSSDSIWPLAACLFLLNALLTDYSPSRSPSRFASVLSVNAALSASVVLASRLADDLSVFALLLFSILIFGQIPMLRTTRTRMGGVWRLLSTFVLTAVALVLATPASGLYATLVGLAFAFSTFLAPATLFWAQRYKNEVHGAWDVAVPVLESLTPDG